MVRYSRQVGTPHPDLEKLNYLFGAQNSQKKGQQQTVWPICSRQKALYILRIDLQCRKIYTIFADSLNFKIKAPILTI